MAHPDDPAVDADADWLRRDNAALRRALEAERTRFADFTSIASDWWWEMSPDLRFSYVSERFGELFGFVPADVIGRRRADLKHADSTDPKWQEHAALLEARKPFRGFETTLVDGTGAVRHIVI